MVRVCSWQILLLCLCASVRGLLNAPSVPAASNMNRPSFPVTSVGVPRGTLPSVKSRRVADAKSPSWGRMPLQTGWLSSSKTILRLVEPILIPSVFILIVYHSYYRGDWQEEGKKRKNFTRRTRRSTEDTERLI